MSQAKQILLATLLERVNLQIFKVSQNIFYFFNVVYSCYKVERNGVINRAVMLWLVKCYDNKMVKLPYNWVIFPLTQQTHKNIGFDLNLCCQVLFTIFIQEQSFSF